MQAGHLHLQDCPSLGGPTAVVGVATVAAASPTHRHARRRCPFRPLIVRIPEPTNRCHRLVAAPPPAAAAVAVVRFVVVAAAAVVFFVLCRRRRCSLPLPFTAAAVCRHARAAELESAWPPMHVIGGWPMM